MAVTIEDALTGTNATFIAELYGRYMESPSLVDGSWATFFAGLEEDGGAILDELRGASWAPSDAGVIGRRVAEADDAAPRAAHPGAPPGRGPSWWVRRRRRDG